MLERLIGSVRSHRVVIALAITILIGLLRPAPSFGSEARPARAEPPIAIDYTVRRLPSADRYEITMRFRGEQGGRSNLTIPSRWADAEHAEQGVEDLRVLTRGAALEETDDASVKRVVHRPGEMLTVRYLLRQIQTGDLDVRWSTTYLPVIQPSYIEWIGWTTWVVPTSDEQAVRVTVRFTGLPGDWNFASSFGLDPSAARFTGSMEHFRAALFVAGDFRLRSRPVTGGQLVTAVRGAWPFRDSELADRMATIVDGERAFWRDDQQGDFLMTLTPIHATGTARSFGGTGLTRSFATWTTPITSLDDLDALLTHEYFHTWNSQALGTFAGPEGPEKWFSEGFTDYYMTLLPLRWRMITLEQYASRFDDVLRALAGLRERERPNAEIGARYFTEGRTVGKLPYWRGMLLAARWDHEIRVASHGSRSLDDAMRRLLHDARRGATVLDAARIAKAVTDAGAVDAAADIERDIDRGRMPVLVDGTLTECIETHVVEDRPFDAGFRYEASMRSRRIVGVDSDGPAYAAGLRDGQILRSMSVTADTDAPVTAGVQDATDGPVRAIEYQPIGRPVRRQHLSVRSGIDPAERARCLAELGAKAR